MTTVPRLVTIVTVALCGLLLTGCGVPLQAQPAPIPADVIPAPLPPTLPTPATTSSATTSAEPSAPAIPTTSPLRLWFVREDGLAAAESSVPVGSPPAVVLEALAAGPTVGQAEQGLRTIAVDPLTGLPLVSVLPITVEPTEWPDPAASATAPEPGVVIVRLSGAFSALPPTEQVLLLGQVVLSLTGAGAEAVSFADDAGTPLAVPLPDGRLLAVPARARDYASLIVQP